MRASASARVSASAPPVVAAAAATLSRGAPAGAAGDRLDARRGQVAGDAAAGAHARDLDQPPGAGAMPRTPSPKRTVPASRIEADRPVRRVRRPPCRAPGARHACPPLPRPRSAGLRFDRLPRRATARDRRRPCRCPMVWRPSVRRCSMRDRVHAGPGELAGCAAAPARGGARPQAQPGDQPRRRSRRRRCAAADRRRRRDAARSTSFGGAPMSSLARQEQAHDAGAGQARRAVGEHVERQIVVAAAAAARSQISQTCGIGARGCRCRSNGAGWRARARRRR